MVAKEVVAACRVDRCWTCGARCTPSRAQRRRCVWQPCAGSTWAPIPPPPLTSTPSTRSCSTTPCALRSPIAPSNALTTHLTCLYDELNLIDYLKSCRQVKYNQYARRFSLLNHSWRSCYVNWIFFLHIDIALQKNCTICDITGCRLWKTI